MKGRVCKECGVRHYMLNERVCGLCHITRSVLRIVDADGEIDCPRDKEFLVSISKCKCCKRNDGIVRKPVKKERRIRSKNDSRGSRKAKLGKAEFIWCRTKRGQRKKPRCKPL